MVCACGMGSAVVAMINVAIIVAVILGMWSVYPLGVFLLLLFPVVLMALCSPISFVLCLLRCGRMSRALCFPFFRFMYAIVIMVIRMIIVTLIPIAVIFGVDCVVCMIELWVSGVGWPIVVINSAMVI